MTTTNAIPIGSGVHVRRIRRSDTAALEAFYAGLSGESRRSRFFSVAGRPSHAQSVSFCTPDHDHREGFVGVVAATAGQASASSATCAWSRPAGISPRWRWPSPTTSSTRGSGRRLLDAGVRWALAEGFTTRPPRRSSAMRPSTTCSPVSGAESKASEPGSGIEDIRIDLRTARIAAPAA